MIGENVMATCSDCEGTRYVLKSYDCEHCKGTGEVRCYDRMGVPKTQPCPYCDHGLVYIEELCTTCQGTGIV
jgi:DnaJ-class molecular chaperone